MAPLSTKVTVATQTGQEAPDLTFHPDKLSTDPHCYECKVKYRDPKPRDLVMYLHAWKYRVRIVFMFYKLLHVAVRPTRFYDATPPH